MTDRTLRRAARAAAAAVLPLLLALPLAAQAPGVLEGRVVTGTGDPVAGVPVVLHRVSQAAQGAIDSARTDAAGRFRLPVPALPPDSAGEFVVLFTTAEAYGVRYFGEPIHGATMTGAPYRVVVYDTASAAALADSVRVVRRDVFLVASNAGGFEVAEVVRIGNAGRRTLVPADGKPLFAVPLPEDALSFEAFTSTEAGDTATVRDVLRMDDRVWITSPLVPGQRDFFFRYRLAPTSRRVALPVSARPDTLNVYVRQPGPEVTAEGLAGPTDFEGEGDRWLRWTSTTADPADPPELRWAGGAIPPVDPRWAGMGVAGIVLAAGTAVALRRRPPARPA